MPDKQNENKLMAMLERKGIVRKAGSEYDQLESDPAAVPSRPDTEIRAMFGPAADGDLPKVTPAARQPVPGMSNPILPGEYSQGQIREQPKPVESKVIDIIKKDLYHTSDIPEEEQPPVMDALSVEQPQAFQPQQQTSLSGGYDSFGFSVGNSGNELQDTADEPDVPEYQQRPREDDYTDKYLDIDDLYEVLSLKSKRTDTIYLVEEYLKSLPESLPDESRREIVSKIVAASGFDYDLLMGDGVLRVKMLKEYAERFARHTDDYVAARQTELDELDQQIVRIRLLIENRKELHKKQFFAIETEAQRLKDILTFISG